MTLTESSFSCILEKFSSKIDLIVCYMYRLSSRKQSFKQISCDLSYLICQYSKNVIIFNIWSELFLDVQHKQYNSLIRNSEDAFNNTSLLFCNNVLGIWDRLKVKIDWIDSDSFWLVCGIINAQNVNCYELLNDCLFYNSISTDLECWGYSNYFAVNGRKIKTYECNVLYKNVEGIQCLCDFVSDTFGNDDIIGMNINKDYNLVWSKNNITKYVLQLDKFCDYIFFLEIFQGGGEFQLEIK